MAACPLGNGDPAMCVASPVNNVDGRGFTRGAGSACDIGAYEAAP